MMECLDLTSWKVLTIKTALQSHFRGCGDVYGLYFIVIVIALICFNAYIHRPTFRTMDSQEFLTQVNECCPELVRPSWVLKKCSKPTRPPKIATKFGGFSPWVSDNYKWPHCEICQKPTSFILQINLSDLPKEFKTRTRLSDGLLQLFDCTGCFEYNGGSLSCVRIVPKEDISVVSLQYLAAIASKELTLAKLPSKLQQYVQDISSITQTHPHWKKQIQVFEEEFVESWEKNLLLEMPDKDEWSPANAAKLGTTCADIQNIDYNLNWPSKLENDKELQLSGPNQGTKVGGWFDWDSSLGYPGYPECPDCPGNPKMDTVFMQININQLFSDYKEGQDRYHHHVISQDRYPDMVFLTLCPSCQKPATFESFPPPLEH